MIHHLLKDALDFNRMLKALEEIAPPTVKIRIAKTMLPWMDLWLQLAAEDAKIEDVRKALWQSGLLQSDFLEKVKP